MSEKENLIFSKIIWPTNIFVGATYVIFIFLPSTGAAEFYAESSIVTFVFAILLFGGAYWFFSVCFVMAISSGLNHILPGGLFTAKKRKIDAKPSIADVDLSVVRELVRQGNKGSFHWIYSEQFPPVERLVAILATQEQQLIKISNKFSFEFIGQKKSLASR